MLSENPAMAASVEHSAGTHRSSTPWFRQTHPLMIIAVAQRIRQTATMTLYLFAAALVLVPLALVLWRRERQWSARTHALRSILDDADALERELQECRTRLREIPALVSQMPPSLALSAHATLTAEPQVQQALHDLLQHRLWLKQQGADASLDALRAAAAALAESRRRLADQLGRLAEVRGELAQAHAPTGDRA